MLLRLWIIPQMPVLPGNPSPPWRQKILKEYPMLKESTPYTPRLFLPTHCFARLPIWRLHFCNHRGFHAVLLRQRIRGADTHYICGTRQMKRVQLDSREAPVFSCTAKNEQKVQNSSTHFPGVTEPRSSIAFSILLVSHRNDIKSSQGTHYT